MNTALEREAMNLLHEHLREAVAVHALRDRTPGATWWKVSLSTVDGSEYVLRTGLTADFAQRMAVEASYCLLELRTGRRIEEFGVLPDAALPGHTLTMEIEEGVVASPPAPGRTEPAWKPDTAARLTALRNLTLQEIAEHRLIPPAAWQRLLGATTPEKVSRVYWRRAGLDHACRPYRCKAYHLVRGQDRMTVCGRLIPSGREFDVHDERAERCNPGQLPPCPGCTPQGDGSQG